ncbi:MAG: hypothetical protein IJ680_02850, partial [Paludibacteraceae bacterium]|nr:hypothetical protein [Paludibacteraceae bacterium]
MQTSAVQYVVNAYVEHFLVEGCSVAEVVVDIRIVQFVAATLLTAAVSIVAYCLLLWLCPGVLRVLTGRA